MSFAFLAQMRLQRYYLFRNQQKNFGESYEKNEKRQIIRGYGGFETL